MERTSSALWFGVLFCLNILSVHCFNVESFNYAVYESQERSMFGFTVAIHKQGYNRGW